MSRAAPTQGKNDAWDLSDANNRAQGSLTLSSSGEGDDGDQRIYELLVDAGFLDRYSPEDSGDTGSYFYPRPSNSQYQASESCDLARHSNPLYHGSEEPRFSNQLYDRSEAPRLSNQLYDRAEAPRFSNQLYDRFEEPRLSNQLYDRSEDPRLSNQWHSQLGSPRSSNQLCSEMEDPRSSNKPCSVPDVPRIPQSSPQLYDNYAFSSLFIPAEVHANLQLRNGDQTNSKDQHTDLPAMDPYPFKGAAQGLEFDAKSEAYRTIDTSLTKLCKVALRDIPAATEGLLSYCQPIPKRLLYPRLRRVYTECQQAYEQLQCESGSIRQQSLLSGEVDDAAVRCLILVHTRLAFQTYLQLVAAVRDERGLEGHLPQFRRVLGPLHKQNREAASLIQSSPWYGNSESLLLQNTP